MPLSTVLYLWLSIYIGKTKQYLLKWFYSESQSIYLQVLPYTSMHTYIAICTVKAQQESLDAHNLQISFNYIQSSK